MIMIESVRLLSERLEVLTPPNDIKQHIPATLIGLGVYNQLIQDYAMDPVLFKECIESRGWYLTTVGDIDCPMFTLLYTNRGMVTIPPYPEGESHPTVSKWILAYNRRRNPLQKFIDYVMSWFK